MIVDLDCAISIGAHTGFFQIKICGVGLAPGR